MEDKMWEAVKLIREGKRIEALKIASELNNKGLNQFLAGDAIIHPITGKFIYKANWRDGMKFG